MIPLMRIEHLNDRGTQFNCPCHSGTRFVVYTKANIPYASCPVCGSVCEPQQCASVTILVPNGQIASTG